MNRSKAEFKGNRERAGLSQKNIADVLNVNIRTVKGWEDPKLDRYNAPAAAWEYMAYELERRGIKVEFRYPSDGAVSTPGSRY